MHTLVQTTASSQRRVVIVGAGISGLVVSSLLNDVQADVVVLRQDMVPDRARCFAGLFDKEDLRAMGADISDSTMLPIGEVRRTVGDLDAESATFERVDLVALEHGAVLDALERQVTAHGVQVADGFTASRLHLLEGAVSGVVDDERGRTVQADVVVLGDESDPRLAEQVQLRPDWLPTELMHLCKERYPALDGFLDQQFQAAQGGYRVITHRFQSSWGAWGVGLLIPGRTGITVQVAMLLEDEMASARHVRDYLDEFKAIPEVADLLPGSNGEGFFTEVVPIGGFDRARRFHTDGFLVANDLLGFTHPLNRDGLSTNLKACAAAALAIREAVRQRDFDARGLARYSTQLETEIIRPLRMTRRRTWALRDRPAWEWASMPQLLPPLEGMTPERISETLPGVATRKAMQRLAGLGRRVGIRPGSRDVIDE